MTFSEQLKHARSTMRLTQAQLAKALECSPRVIWNWESGLVEPMKITQEGALARLARLHMAAVSAHSANNS